MRAYRLMILLAIIAAVALGGYAVWQEIDRTPVAPQGETASSTVRENEQLNENAAALAISFEEYPAAKAPSGLLVADVHFDRFPAAQEFRTAIEEAVAQGPNFSGHYTVATWGCGTSCQGSAVVDNTTGEIVAWGIVSSYGLAYELESRLLVVNPPQELPSEPQPALSTDYYLLEEGELRLIEKRDIYGALIPCDFEPVLARNPITGQEKRFDSPCAVPGGWEVPQPGMGMISGTVTVGPVCPVAREDEPCEVSPEVYTSREVIAYRDDAVAVASRTHLNADGSYQFRLPPGTYIIDIAREGIDRSPELPRTVTLDAGETETLDFFIDTGIR